MLLGLINLYLLKGIWGNWMRLRAAQRNIVLAHQQDSSSTLENPTSVIISLPVSFLASTSSDKKGSSVPSPGPDNPTAEDTGVESETKEYTALPTSSPSHMKSSGTLTTTSDSSAAVPSPASSSSNAKDRALAEAQAAYEKVVKEVSSFGIFSKFCPRVLQIVDKPWKLFFVGLIFGLGFDTATEVALLAMSATTAVNGLPLITIMVLPLLFTAGMVLLGIFTSLYLLPISSFQHLCLCFELDSTDGVVMVYAYGWATLDPLRKILYNFFITAASVCVALLLGLIEAFQVIQQAANLDGPFWDWIANIDFNYIGFGVIGVFIFMFALSMVVYRYEHIDLSLFDIISMFSRSLICLSCLIFAIILSFLSFFLFFSFVGVPPPRPPALELASSESSPLPSPGPAAPFIACAPSLPASPPATGDR